jgi:RHS repeat-associated protein
MYYPFGEVRWASAEMPTDFGYTGQRLDGTGLMFYNARYYAPVLGRFVQADTIVPEPGNSQALNRYSYVYNNPLGYVDPSGHWPGWLEKAAGAAHQFIDDMTGGIPTKITGDGWKYNSDPDYQAGRAIGRGASVVLSTAMAIDGTAKAAGAVASMGPTAVATGGCAAATGGTCVAVGGVALTGEAVVAVAGTAEAAYGGVVLAKISGDPLGGSSRKERPQREIRKSIRSLEKRMTEHQAKLEAYRNNPDAFDHLGLLRNAPNEEIRQSIINGRIRHLEQEIDNFSTQIEILRALLGE